MVSFCHNFIGSMKNLISESDKAPTQIERLHPAWAPLSHVTSTCLSIARARTHTLSSFHHCSPRALQSYKFVPRDHATARRVGTKLRDDSCELRVNCTKCEHVLPLSLVDSPHVHPGRTPRVLRTTPP
jgi:hypothetical protein